MLRSQLLLPVAVRHILQILDSAEFCKYEKRVEAPLLSPAHRTARLDWCEKFIGKPRSYWGHVVFSDEKRFCLDGSDKATYY